MASRAVKLRLGAITSGRLGIDTYDPDKLMLGNCMGQWTGGTSEAKFCGPLPIVLGRPVEASTSIPAIFPRPLRWANSATKRINWVFFADNAAAAATRRIVAYEHDLITNTFTWKGFITLTYPTATAHTIRGLSFDYRLENTGTVSVSGTAVTGVGTNWLTDRTPIGCRIGFGSTDPAAITTWYTISAMASDTGITLATSAGTIGAGTAYVIEDLRIITLTTNATTTNGGVYLAKGLSWDLFNSGGTTIPAAVSTDGIRAVYWLKDAATILNTVGNGITLDAETSATSRVLWSGDGTTTMRLFKHDIRAALTLATGAATNQFQFATAVSAALTGTASQNDNLVGATLGHGPGSGVKCMYFTTTTRVYRTKASSTITTGDTTFITGGDVMTEVPPGSVNTYAATAVLNSLTYLSSIDKLVVMSSASAATRSYVTQYRTDAGQMDRIFLPDSRQLNQAAASSDVTPWLSSLSVTQTVGDDENGMLYFAGIATNSTGNVIFGASLASDWEYAATTNQRILFPRMSTSDAAKLTCGFASSVEVIGGRTGQNLGMATEPFRLNYRTAGITDNSGGWTLMDDSFDLSSATPGTHIQLMAEFRTIGLTGIPARILQVGVLYENTETDSHYQFSEAKTVAANREFAWRFSTAFGGAVPALKVWLYDATDPEAETTLLTDTTTASANGTWQRSTDGTAWSAWNNTDKGNDTTYVRYTPASIAGNPLVRAVLTLA